MSRLRLNMIITVLFMIFAMLQYRLWFESGGIRDMTRLKKTLAEQNRENAKVKQRNEELLFQIQRIQNSKDALESRARNELGMIKKDETFYQVVR